MAITTREEIRSEILENLSYLKETPYPEDMIQELADSNTPIYYSDVLAEWQQMPSEYNDKWKEYGYDANKNEGGILALMQIDLTFYYLDAFQEVWEEIKEEEDIQEVNYTL
jgi:hypothetical protein